MYVLSAPHFDLVHLPRSSCSSSADYYPSSSRASRVFRRGSTSRTLARATGSTSSRSSRSSSSAMSSTRQSAATPSTCALYCSSPLAWTAEVTAPLFCRLQLWLVSNYGNLAILVKSPWSFTWDPFMCGIVAFSVQAFYAYRCVALPFPSLAMNLTDSFPSLAASSSSRRRTTLSLPSSEYSPSSRSRSPSGRLGRFTFSTRSSRYAFSPVLARFALTSRRLQRFGEFRYGVLLWLFSAASADVLITGSLCVFLPPSPLHSRLTLFLRRSIFYLKRASRGDHQRSSSMVSRILLVTVETNGLTCLFAIADAILFAVVPDQSWHGASPFAVLSPFAGLTNPPSQQSSRTSPSSSCTSTVSSSPVRLPSFLPSSPHQLRHRGELPLPFLDTSPCPASPSQPDFSPPFHSQLPQVPQIRLPNRQLRRLLPRPHHSCVAWRLVRYGQGLCVPFVG